MTPFPARTLIAALCLIFGFASRVAAQGVPVVALSDSNRATWSAEDWQVFQDKVQWGASAGLDTIPAGEAIVRMGETFVGTPYRAGTLEVPGPERVVVNLHELDCVTFVETVLALTRFVRQDGVVPLADSLRARTRYEAYLRDIRYLAGVVEGYASRLHYFSDWLASNASAGHIEIMTGQLGGVPDSRPVTFMTSHANAYPALSDSGTLAKIVIVEGQLNSGSVRQVVPKDSIAAIVNGIRDGDIIAAASTTTGLDASHTGFAFWTNGELHLMHAPLTGSPVEISPLPLAERIQGIPSQWGIMVARVDEAWLRPTKMTASPEHHH